jgi:threonine dehydrogenase-like Zn-dependent dehydrogenase
MCFFTWNVSDQQKRSEMCKIIGSPMVLHLDPAQALKTNAGKACPHWSMNFIFYYVRDALLQKESLFYRRNNPLILLHRPMKALKYSEAAGVQLLDDAPVPACTEGEALIRVLRAAICSTDLEIIKGYVPGFNHVLGHEFVGIVAECASNPSLVGRRVCGEINCRQQDGFTHPDPIFVRNHAPNRTVLGIIGRDGSMAEYLTLPVVNLHLVPEGLTDQEACFAEPLAAACRIAEQGLASPSDRVAVVGDGKLGLLVAQALITRGCHVTHFGRHRRKLELVDGAAELVVLSSGGAAEVHDPAGTSDSPFPALAEELKARQGTFDVVIEASGASAGILSALALVRPLGTVVVKSTCSTVARRQVPWSEVGNDVWWLRSAWWDRGAALFRRRWRRLKTPA